MDAASLVWFAGQALSVVALLSGALLTLVPVETMLSWLGTQRGPTAGQSSCPERSECHATCDHWRYAECHPPCNHRLFLEAEW